MIEGPQVLGGGIRSQRSVSPQQMMAPQDGGGRLRTGVVDYMGGLQTMPPQAGPRSLSGDRIVNIRDVSPPAASAPPAMFTTAAVPQVQAQDSTVSLSAVPLAEAAEEENEFLRSRVGELEQSRRELEQQLYEYRNAPQSTTVPASEREISTLQRRLREAEESKATALRAHEARLSEIKTLEGQIIQLRGQQQSQAGLAQGGSERLLDLQQQLEKANASEAAYRRRAEDQAAKIEEQAQDLQRSRAILSQASSTAMGARERERLELEQKFASVNREKEDHKRFAEQKANELQESKARQSRDMQDIERKMSEFTVMEDEYQKQLQEDRRTIGDLQMRLEGESKSKDFHMGQNESHQEHIQNLEGEVAYLKTVEVYHKNQSDLHRREVQRLKRLREEDAPPPYVPRMPLKALEERVMHLACFTMMGVCALPIVGALACLSDENYVFWLGRTWPWMIIGGCTFVFVLFGFTLQGLFERALPEHRSQFTMAFTWATFAALLGVILVPLSLLANKDALNIAGTVSQGCLTALPQSEMLVDYSQVLYNIRLSQNCTGSKSVTECHGWAANKYTTYLQYLEEDFQCGPLCPENPPQARAVVSPGLYKTVATKKPTIAPPPMVGPPLQNALGNGAFLQAADGLVAQQVQLHEHQAAVLPPSAGIMETALPHMQADKLFSEGKTRMTCYPLIATRLNVLVTTFGGLWYWEGMGLIIISLLTSLYAGMYFALGMA